MDKYLIAILKEVNTIIIPGIGALTIVNQATGEVMFMSFMKFDDGKLADHIAQKENWELNEAKNLVSKYVRDINTKLDQGDTYDIYQFGSFSKNSEGEIEFTSWDGLSNSSSDSNTESVSDSAEETINEVIESPEIEEENLAPEDPIQDKLEEIQDKADEATVELHNEVEEITDEVEDPSIDGLTDLIEDVFIPEEKIELKDEVKPPVTPISEEEQWKDDLDVPPINIKKEIPKKPIIEKAKKDKVKKKRGVGFYILIAVLVLLIGGGTYFGMHYNELKQHIPFLADNTEVELVKPIIENIEEQEPITSEEPTVEEPIMEEPASVESKVIEAQPEPVKVTSNNGLTINQSLPIQIIVGSFTEESNAQRKISQLIETGVKAEMIGRYDGLHLVSIASFNSTSEVKANAETIKSAAGSYWIFKK